MREHARHLVESSRLTGQMELLPLHEYIRELSSKAGQVWEAVMKLPRSLSLG